jgi:hypothetical protein
MISLSTYTAIHVAISLIGLVSGFVVLAGLLNGKRLDVWTAVFLVSTLATSLTGFGFPFQEILPSHIVGAVSVVLLALAIVARYRQEMEGGWRAVYVITAVTSLYLNVFVLIVQLFLKIPMLKDLAPTQSEPPFFIAQGLALVVFVWLGYQATVRFGDEVRTRMTAA